MEDPSGNVNHNNFQDIESFLELGGRRGKQLQVLTDGIEARVLVAFAAGNSGAALWFEPTDQPVVWRVLDEADLRRKKKPSTPPSATPPAS